MRFHIEGQTESKVIPNISRNKTKFPIETPGVVIRTEIVQSVVVQETNVIPRQNTGLDLTLQRWIIENKFEKRLEKP